MDWFSWFDKGEEEKVTETKPDLWKTFEENPTLSEPLEDILEGSSGAETASASEVALGRRRAEIRSRDGTQEREDHIVRSKSSEDYNARDAYRVADEALGSSGETSGDTGVVCNASSRDVTESSACLADDSNHDEEEDEEEEGEVEDIDLEVVEQYDHAFNEFIAAHPQFVVASPDVVHSLRVCKLQKLLERNTSIEAELQEQLVLIDKSKSRMEVAYQRELKDASRRKAAREVHLASKLAASQKTTTAMEAKLMWKLVSTFEASSKKHHRLREQLKSKHVEGGRQGLLEALPKDDQFQSIRDAMLVPPSPEPLRYEQKMDMQQFQIDNAFLHSEVTVLEKKLKHVKAATKKHAWVESMLVRIDPKVLAAVKEKYAKSKGVTL